MATDIPVLREYLTAGEDALHVPPADPNALAGAIRSLMGDEALRDPAAEHRRASGGQVHA